MFKKIRPPEHPDVALAMAELGLAYSDVDDLQTGLAFLQEAEKIHQKIYSDGHPELAKNYYYLGLIWKKLGDAAKVHQSMDMALVVYQKFYHEEHPQIQKVKTDCSNLGFEGFNVQSQAASPALQSIFITTTP